MDGGKGVLVRNKETDAKDIDKAKEKGECDEDEQKG